MTRFRQENGYITAISLVILAAGSIIGAISSKMTQADLSLANAYIQQKQAFYAAESGLNYAVARMGVLTGSPDDPNWSVTIPGNLPTGETFRVVIKHKVVDGKVVKWADNNNDFVFRECTSCPGKPVERIISTGFSRGGSQQAVATELFPEPLFADVAAALYAGGDSVVSNNTSATAEGEFGYIADTAVCLEAPDVITTSSALEGFQATDFTGQTGMVPVLLNNQNPYPVVKVIENLKGRATNVAHEAHLVLGSEESYGLYYYSTSLNADHLSGYGILMIEGHATFGGSVDWHGLILAKGDSRFEGFAAKEIFGGFVSGGKVVIDSSPAFYYDCRELNSVKTKFSRYERRLWASDIPADW